MIVCICEKPSVALEVAKVLGARTKKDGYYEGNGYQVTWTFGHLCELKSPDKYYPQWKKWSMSVLPMIPPHYEVELINNPGIKKQFKVIKDLYKKADSIVNCGDAGQEGELIQRWVMQLAGVKCPVKRLWISMNCTRLYTLRYGQYKQLLSVGRVQTPTLAMIVARDNEIEHFVPKPYWTLSTKYRDTVFTNSSFQTQQAAEEALALARRSPLIIKDVLEKRSSEQPPQLYDLTALQVDCNRKYGFSADTTLKNLQTLYEKKLTSYPRVDTRFLTDDIFPKCPDIIANLTDVCAGARPLVGHQLPKSKRVFDNSKVTDHHAIIPTGDTRNLSTLNDFEYKVYDLVVRRFCAAFYPACEYAQTTVLANASSLTFKVTGRTILSEGWRTVYGKELIDDDSQSNEKVTLPSFRVGESGQHTPSIEKKMTTAPKHYTEASLLQAMETAGKFVDDETLKEAMKENGIGRPSSRASIIETLVKRDYVRRDHRNLISNPAGRNLIAQIHSTLLKSPELTGQWEHKLRQIERGSYSLQDFMQELEHQLVTMIKEVQST